MVHLVIFCLRVLVDSHTGDSQPKSRPILMANRLHAVELPTSVCASPQKESPLWEAGDVPDVFFSEISLDMF